MRRLLQRLDNGLFFQAKGVWTNDPTHARAFSSTAAAMKYVFNENMPPVQLVLKFEDSSFDIRMPCGPYRPEPRAAKEHIKPPAT